MKKILFLILTFLMTAVLFCSCRTVNDTKPTNETANPNAAVSIAK